MQALTRIALTLLSSIVFLFAPPVAAQNSKLGIVIMHGKGGSPNRHVNELASALESKGYLVANLEMPWSGRRNYDSTVPEAENEVEAALAKLRAQGAQKVFVAGHSQGGLFALYFGNKHKVDGIIAIAPGGNVANSTFTEKLGPQVEQARKMIAEGKGDEIGSFMDYEGSKGTYPIVTTATRYFSWFDPEGAMNQTKASRNLNPNIPLLYIAPKNDHAGLLKTKQSMLDALPPPNPLSTIYEPDASHTGAPSASTEEIISWTSRVATAPASTPAR
jgi:pimeloyl-ACP methyl ester carboxylesterase